MQGVVFGSLMLSVSFVWLMSQCYTSTYVWAFAPEPIEACYCGMQIARLAAPGHLHAQRTGAVGISFIMLRVGGGGWGGGAPLDIFV